MSDGGDAAARAAALDPAQSFIVQAPAGSGKTELLIQRFLALLATVQQPEQVVAITFTRKAAAEMRRRVLNALRSAADDKPSAQPHQRTAFDLARAVIARDRAHDWQLLAQPQRLRIDTLDAFNAWLARQLPVLADGVAAADVVDKPDDLYREAARRCVAGVAGDDQTLARALRTLLRDVGNDCAQLEQLLAALLPRRDQWLRLLLGDAAELRPLLEGALQRLVDAEIAAAARLAGFVDPPLLAALAPLLQHAAGAAGEPLRMTLAPWLALERPPPSGAVALSAWRGIAALLLTKQGDWRKRVAKPEGFGPEHAALRDRLRALLEVLQAHEALRAALATVASLPDPRYTEQQWQSLAALQVVLVRLAAELKVAFAERRAVDFVELALAAQRALGQVDAPSELLLALDRRIQHLLVDEFQDTSQSQRRLLELLTAGWQPDDGRTLFLVGDPMQSIYRFRDADMSLFLLAKQRGIGAVRLRSLTLQRNFRSAPAIVSWVNTAFASVFPAADEIETGRAAFRESLATRAPEGSQLVGTHAAAVPGGEVASVVAILAEERRRDPGQSIAVLVQNRRHLEGLRERLRERGLAVHAVEIDSLGEQTVAQDLAGLTRALLHLDDRIAWLAVLRAPWCGLRFADLDALCGDEHKSAVWDLLQQPQRVARLSDDGQARARSVVATLTAAFAAREQATLSRWIERTWIELGGPACVDDNAALLSADQFFALLAAAERGGDLDDPAVLQRALETVQPQADAPREQGIEIMTMHRAKGLEFDTVVLLGLAREPRPDEPKALQWLARATADGRDDLVMVPAAFAADDGARLADFVRRAERERDAAERARLLYVATTRARERLHLVWQLSAGEDAPPASSLLAHLWPVVSATPHETEPAAARAPATAVAITPVLRRLVEPAGRAASLSTAGALAPPRPEFVWAGQAAAHVGTVVHRYLQRIAEQGLERWTVQRVAESTPRFARELELLGVDAAERAGAADRVGLALSRSLADRHGRWVLAPHAEARSELRLTLRTGSTLEHVRLDRTFVADGARWIVDFKTSEHEGGSLSAFLDSEVERYAPQLERYALAVAATDSRPVQLGLYFPLLGELRSWPAAVTASRSS